MIEKCPVCDEKIYILIIQPPETSTTSGGTLTMSTPTTTFSDISYTLTTHIYKCCNPKCWVTKIKESWE